MKFEWHDSKSQSNKRKHGISFSEALTIFNDPFILSKYDKEHSTDNEDRWNSIGEASVKAVLMVVHLCREDESKIRIISARKATNNEKKMYYYRREQMQ
ncbi:MAG: BrnT family toxin [Spirochaetales bacterium]|nr:BrnT family toxin [Spirochaetales bacterium]